MFKDKSDYELAMPHLMEIWEDDARELIETLRGVARAAETAWPHMFSHIRAKFTKERRAYEALYEALDALPEWVLEE